MPAARRPLLPPEAALQQAWAQGPLPQPLRCRDGEPLRVIFRGRANSGPGPDFLDAVFLGPDRHPFGGDVELHRRPSDWWAHGHHRDPAYARVVLHVVAAADGDGGPGRGALGRVAVLGALVGVGPAGLPPLAAAFPPGGFPADDRSGPPGPGGRGGPGEGGDAQDAVRPCCASALTPQPHALAAALGRLGLRRLRAKAGALRAEFATSDRGSLASCQAQRDQVAYQALLGALGQGSAEAATMRAVAVAAPLAALPFALAEALPVARRGGDAATLEATVFETTAFETTTLEASLLAAYEAERRSRASAAHASARPANSVPRRLRAAAVLLARAHGSGGDGALAARLEAWARASLPEVVRDLGKDSGPGRQRALQLLVDAAYPFALAAAPADANRLERRWLALPGARYGRTEALRARLSEAGLQDWRNGGTQALLDLQRGYCGRGAAAVCPLNRFRAPPPRAALSQRPSACDRGGTPGV